MRIIVIGGDGYCGWALSLHLSARGHEVAIVDSLIRRSWDRELGVDSLTPIADMKERTREWTRLTGRTISFFENDVTDYEALCSILSQVKPDAIVHLGQQRSAPYSMIDRDHAVCTHVNNTVGNLNLLWAMTEIVPQTHLVKLGTMGEYGTPGIDIEEGFITIQHKGRRATLPFPKVPGSFYHLTKVSDSDNVYFACRTWGIAATDVNQGIVYGLDTPETRLSPVLINRFDYDGVFGTVLNRFCVQVALGHPLTVYGRGGQTRGFIDLRDTVRCLELALFDPAEPGEYRVFNQYTETFSVIELAHRVSRVAADLGIAPVVEHLENPRVEQEMHYYTAQNRRLLDRGLMPTFLSDETIATSIRTAFEHRERILEEVVRPRVQWASARSASAAGRSTTPAQVQPV